MPSKKVLKSAAHDYIHDPTYPTLQQVALRYGLKSNRNIRALRAYIPDKLFHQLKLVRYSRSKTGAKNPMTGKFEELHPNWKGACSDQKGYLTEKRDGKRQFQHRLVMAKALGLKTLPRGWEVHHIVESDTENNSIHNLALMTKKGHIRFHRPPSYRLTLWEQVKSGTLKLKKITVTSRKG